MSFIPPLTISRSTPCEATRRYRRLSSCGSVRDDRKDGSDLQFARGQNLRDLIQLVSRESLTLDRTSFDGDLDTAPGFDLRAKPFFKFHVVGCMRPSPRFRRSPKLGWNIGNAVDAWCAKAIVFSSCSNLSQYLRFSHARRFQNYASRFGSDRCQAAAWTIPPFLRIPWILKTPGNGHLSHFVAE